MYVKYTSIYELILTHVSIKEYFFISPYCDMFISHLLNIVRLTIES